MTSLFVPLNSGTVVKSFTSSSKGQRSIVRIELEVPDPHELGFLLSELAKAQGPAKGRRAAPTQRRPLLLEHKPGDVDD